jgi:hypothetical protein
MLISVGYGVIFLDDSLRSYKLISLYKRKKFSLKNLLIIAILINASF